VRCSILQLMNLVVPRHSYLIMEGIPSNSKIIIHMSTLQRNVEDRFHN